MRKRSSWDDDGYGFWLKLVMFAALAWIGYEAYKSWEARQAVSEPVREKSVQHLEPSKPIPSPTGSTATPMTHMPADTGQVYRCGNTYSHQPCEGGQAVNTANAVAESGGSSAMREIYLCKDFQGQLFWESSPRSLNGRFMERIASVPTNVSWDQQVAIARAQRDKAQAIEAEQMVPVVPRVVTQKSNAGECQALEGLIRQLDQECRVKSCNMRELDSVRNQRRDARDRQFRIGC